MKKVILILIALIAIMTGCEKYNLNKIYGDHTLINYTVDGIDSMNTFKDSLGTLFQFNYDEVSNENICVIGGVRNDGQGTLVTWNWELNNSDKILSQVISAGFSIGTGPFGVGKNNIEWEILKLKSNYLKLKTNYNNKEYIIELEEN